MTPSPENLRDIQRERRALALNSPEIWAAAHTATNIALEHNPAEMFDRMLQFFVEYDAFRTQRVEELKRDLVEALRWSAKPIPVDESFYKEWRAAAELAQKEGLTFPEAYKRVTSQNAQPQRPVNTAVDAEGGSVLGR
jgi:hypothetical protein